MSDLPETDTGAAFAAGVATATAEQAEQAASTAEFKAEMAEDRAEAAEARADAAAEAAWATAASVEDLRTELAQLRDAVTPKADTPGAEGAGAVPAPERKEASTPPEPVEPGKDAADKPRRKYGSRAWFGG